MGEPRVHDVMHYKTPNTLSSLTIGAESGHASMHFELPYTNL